MNQLGVRQVTYRCNGPIEVLVVASEPLLLRDRHVARGVLLDLREHGKGSELGVTYLPHECPGFSVQKVPSFSPAKSAVNYAE